MIKLRIAAAETRVELAREQLMTSIEQLADLLEPHKIAHDLWESAKNKGADIAEDAVDAVKRRPVATGGIIAAIAMFLAREPIMDGVARLYGGMTSDDEEAPPKSPVRKPAIPRKRSAPRSARKTETK